MAQQDGHEPDDARNSHMHIEFQFGMSLGYRRRRPDSTDVWEMRVDSFSLILIGALVAIILLAIIVPRVFELVTTWVATH